MACFKMTCGADIPVEIVKIELGKIYMRSKDSGQDIILLVSPSEAGDIADAIAMPDPASLEGGSHYTEAMIGAPLK